jgi:hypothetical protein
VNEDEFLLLIERQLLFLQKYYILMLEEGTRRGKGDDSKGFELRSGTASLMIPVRMEREKEFF